MAETLTAEEKIVLINENLQEVLKPEIIEDVIKKQNRPLRIYWGKQYTSSVKSPQLLSPSSDFFLFLYLTNMQLIQALQPLAAHIAATSCP